MYGQERDRDYVDFDDDSDIESAESSDDEIDILLHGTPEQKRKLCQKAKEGRSSSEDEFEKEMNAELNVKVEALEARRSSLSQDTGQAGSGPSGEVTGGNGDEEQKYYDEVYFDSDEEEMVTKGDERSKRKQLSNDDLLYDPEDDDSNQLWIDNRRNAYLNRGRDKKANKEIPLPNSDAVLSCPACMTTLCLDCQRHDIYKSQYRAMFVSNCSVNKTEFLKYPVPNSKQKKKKKHGPSTSNADTDSKYNPVKCSECETVVAVYDTDEVYHFFNVLSSYG